MIDDLGSYSIRNFIPFLDEVYFRLFERQYEDLWPLHLLTLAGGVAAIVLAWLGKTRATAVLLGFTFAVCAVTFHFRLYAELTPVGSVFGWAFLIQIPLLLIWGFTTKRQERFRPTVPTVTGAAIAVFALAIHPFLAIATGREPAGAECLGMAPDPTAAFILGILLITARPVWFLLLFPIPLLWSATTGATLDSLDAPLPMTLPILAA
ncbi:MAG TPA: DUF6064 family protein, partial [Luteolibacter sp.]|nr:DUF6064 family protein [Luteolibacter sp.]